MRIVEAVMVSVAALALLAWVIGRPHTLRPTRTHGRSTRDDGDVPGDTTSYSSWDNGTATSSDASNDAADTCDASDSGDSGDAGSCDGGSDGGGSD